ncbi:hypothetical protein BGZ90_001005, partial [Linnemannia elongata]
SVLLPLHLSSSTIMLTLLSLVPSRLISLLQLSNPHLPLDPQLSQSKSFFNPVLLSSAPPLLVLLPLRRVLLLSLLLSSSATMLALPNLVPSLLITPLQLSDPHLPLDSHLSQS